MDVQAHLLQLSLEHAATLRVELPLHEVRHEVHDVDVGPRVEQAARGFQAQQSPAQDRGPADTVRRTPASDRSPRACGTRRRRA